MYAAQGLDRSRVAIAPLRHVCITDDKAEAASFLDNARHQIRLSQSLRFREELIDGTMLVEKTYKGEPTRRSSQATSWSATPKRWPSARRAHAAAGPSHMLLHFQAGASPQRPR